MKRDAMEEGTPPTQRARTEAPGEDAAAARPAATLFAPADSKPHRVHHKSLPSHSDRMHPRNRYLKQPPDFLGLAKGVYGAAFADLLSPYVQTNKNTQVGYINFNDPQACLALTKVLLAKDFAVQGWDLPAGNLVPRVPGRLNHVLWAEDLLKEESGIAASPQRPLRVVDLGVGANLIYPILGARVCHWGFTLGLDCEPSALQVAAKNAQAAGLEGQLELRQAPMLAGFTTQGPLASALRANDGDFDLLVCNPPFFSSAAEAQSSQKSHVAAKAAADEDEAECGDVGVLHEMVCTGGEEQFLSTLVADSVRLGAARVRWYATLVGRKASLRAVMKKMAELGVQNIRTTRFFQGKTVRWGLAWSLTADGCDARGRIPPGALAAITSKLENKHRGKPVKTFIVEAAAGEAAGLTGAEVLARVSTFYNEYRALKVACGMDAAEDNTLEATLQDAYVAGDGSSGDVHLEVGVEEAGDGSGRVQVDVRSLDGDTWADLAPKARSLVDGMEGEVARTNRRWRRMLAKGSGTSTATA